MKQCPEYTLPEFSMNCKPIAYRETYPKKIFINVETNEVFDEFENLIGYGELSDDGELLRLNGISALHKK